MKTVKEVSRLTGLSVRALHHYDAIGLLRPSRTTPAGYRLYDDAALERLQMILLFRELEFPLEQIRQMHPIKIVFLSQFHNYLPGTTLDLQRMSKPGAR